MKRFIAAAFALIGLALTTGALAAPPEGGEARAAEGRSVVVREPGQGHYSVVHHVILPSCDPGEVLVCEVNDNGVTFICEEELEEV